MTNNGRPLSRKQTVRLMVGLTILAWATQTLLKQWGHGAEPPTAAPAEVVEKFVPGNSRYQAGATLEMRCEATVIGAEVKLRQVCRWSEADQAIFDPIGDLVLFRLGHPTPFKTISMPEIRGILRDAGVNIAAINFAGATSCTVARSDVEYDEKNALDQWIAARETPPPLQGRLETDAVAAAPVAENDSPVRSLRHALIADLATRLNLPAETLQVNFRQQDEKALNISQPLFQFWIEPLRGKSLGQVSWSVSIRGADGNTRKVTINAEARAWQNQIVVARPLAFRQVIRHEDLIERRSLVDQLSDDPLLAMDQAVGQQAGRDLKPGTVLTGKMIDPVQLVKTGQFITVTLEQGTVRIKTVVRALESGGYGQTIRVKNEATKDVFQVVLTGPQTATMNLAAPVLSSGQ